MAAGRCRGQAVASGMVNSGWAKVAGCRACKGGRGGMQACEGAGDMAAHRCVRCKGHGLSGGCCGSVPGPRIPETTHLGMENLFQVETDFPQPMD